MAKLQDERFGGSGRGDDHSPDRREEPFDDPEEHRVIENRRFQGSLPPTPELYARAREQWHRLPGSVVRSPMDPVVSDPASAKHDPAGTGQSGKKGTER